MISQHKRDGRSCIVMSKNYGELVVYWIVSMCNKITYVAHAKQGTVLVCMCGGLKHKKHLCVTNALSFQAEETFPEYLLCRQHLDTAKPVECNEHSPTE